jgi:small subunit ribosomal protein S15
LGTRTNDEGEKWKASALAKVLIDDESLSPSTELKPEKFSIGKVNVPKHLGFGVDTAEKEMLFNVLPKLTAEMAVQKGQKNLAQQAQVKTTAKMDPAQAKLTAEKLAAELKQQEKTQLDKANKFAKVLDLRNANAPGVAFVNRRRVISAFSAQENPFNPGHTEVQGAQPNQVH